MLKSFFISMRSQQWYKNLVLFIGILFSLNLLNIQMWFDVIAAFLIFCLISGSEYLINDVIDIEKDKSHPQKSKRPIASGELTPFSALSGAIILTCVGLVCAYYLSLSFFFSVIAYFILILAYSLVLKYYIVVDVLTISTGFVIRAIAGCLVIGVIVSPWLILCAFFLALFLALGKRRHEMILMGTEANNHRKILEGCTEGMVNQMVTITTAVLIMSYSLYTFLMDNLAMMITIPFVTYGIFRYLYLIHVKNLGGEPEILFKDRGLVICMVLWGMIAIIVLYITKLQNL